MNAFEIQNQRLVDQEILAYVRGMQAMAPVRAESVENYLRRVRRIAVQHAYLADRLADLEGRRYLARETRFEPGEGKVDYFAVTPAARCALDGAAPWDWEK
jgi:hypothetical protein